MNPAPRARSRPSPRRHGGSVLIVVLVVCLGLASLALVLGHSMLMAYRGSDNEIAGRQAEAATLGAVQYAETLMTGVAVPGDVPDPSTYQSAAVPVGEASFWFIGEPAAGNTNNAGDQPEFGLVDEASKLNLNTATPDMFMKLPGMTDELAQALKDWRTTPAAAATAAAASTTGGLTITTGTVKQAAFESVEEAGLVIGGADPTMLYGDDANLNHVLDSEETSTQSGGVGQGQFFAGLMEYCTVFSRESNTLSDGTKRTPITNQRAVTTLVNTMLGAASARQMTGSIFLRVGGLKIAGGNGWVGSVLEFAAFSGLSATDFAKISPYLANSSAAFSTGLINVNTASQTVLACVPGIGDDLAAALVSARAQRGTSPDLSDWSWVSAILKDRGCHDAGPYLTTRSYQWSADVAAVGRYGRGYRRTRFVIDSSTGTPQVVYRRDLSGLGWALGLDARHALQTQTSLAQGGVAQ